MFTDRTVGMSRIQNMPEDSIVYNSYPSGQDLSQYSTLYAPRNISTSPWVASTQFHDNHVSSLQQWSDFGLDVDFNLPAYSTAVHTPSSFILHQNARWTSIHDTNSSAFVPLPASITAFQFPQGVEFNQVRVMDPRADNKDTTSMSHLLQSQENSEEVFSASDATEMKLQEERSKAARSHPLYQQSREKDGKYHCPRKGETGCSHKPTSLKCHYVYLDSHLKPFRCSKKTCVGISFSSNACLLRHERETHGMQSHTENLCHFGTCGRAKPGRGFPRRYNLFDHMKRVHYDGLTTEHSTSIISSHIQRKTVSRKRKASTEESLEKCHKVIKKTVE
ncbi:hypothetical protein HBI23_256440 [Parastagonospora nodorum]|nr:hypothetical protein HBI23_256440 [Parastagonospora nodorum]KAH5620471.1 hypothetical protein HBI51_251270 [Parastagonospora nodorum]KAH5983077.1 hypothetical protein HBI84_249240 [Parastagonospora nodorum]KAH6132828.1 hypothetical protein HBI68_254720 [Parastagonospora nodorum]KAH6383225.1 hypothetical protein HBI60_257800 [Parastagonospora nodorum]